MKKLSLYTLLIIAFALPVSLQAQQVLSTGLSTENLTAVKENGNVVISGVMKTTDLDIKGQEMVYLTPILYSADSTRWHQFDPIVVAGGIRYKVLRRELRLNNARFEKTPQVIMKRKRNREEIIPLQMSVPYESWMDNSRLVLHEDLMGCQCITDESNWYTLMSPVLPTPPNFDVSYIVPPKEEVKKRSATYAAHINFEVGKHQILENFKNNREVLGTVDSIFRAVRSDQNITIDHFTITGYASPEGSYPSNMMLSKNRAEAFVQYLSGKYNIARSQITTDWKGEDWDGLRKAVASSGLANRQEVLDIIDNVADIPTRENRIIRLEGGKTYQSMLREQYPPLRRNEYTISFTVKDFTLAEARQLIKTKPEYLSQQEMYLVAQSYPVNSAEYAEAYHTMARIYPNDNTAQLNNAAAELTEGHAAPAMDKLIKMNTPEAWNNLGVAYFHQKDYVKAAEFFKKAATTGLPAGISNLSMLETYMKAMK